MTKKGQDTLEGLLATEFDLTDSPDFIGRQHESYRAVPILDDPSWADEPYVAEEFKLFGRKLKQLIAEFHIRPVIIDFYQENGYEIRFRSGPESYILDFKAEKEGEELQGRISNFAEDGRPYLRVTVENELLKPSDDSSP